jgi:hypothetical protein
LIENIKISAAALGYSVTIKLFPNPDKPKLITAISFEKTSPNEEIISRFISHRTTNRKSYDKTLITNQQEQELLRSVDEVNEGGRVKFTSDPEKIKILGQAVAANEIVTLEDKNLHQLFFNEIVWTSKEEKIKKTGLYLKTMELKPPQQKALRLFSNWSLMKIANKIGVAKAIARSNSKVYSTAPVVGIVIIDDEDKDFITAGRIIERIWLKATRMGLSFHLITGVIFLWQRIFLGNYKELSDTHRRLIKSEYENIKNIFSVQNEIISAVFRIGHSKDPSAFSGKLPPKITFR